MWQRFSEAARRVIFYAQEEGQRFGEGYVSTEHMLLGLCRDADTTAARVFEKFGVPLERIKREVEKQLPKDDPRPSQDMTLTPRAKRVIDLAYAHARMADDNFIGTEHLLLGLIAEKDGLAGRILDKLQINLEIARAQVIQVRIEEGNPVGTGAFGDMPPLPREPRRMNEGEQVLAHMLLMRQQLCRIEFFALNLLAEREVSDLLKAVGADREKALLVVESSVTRRMWGSGDGDEPDANALSNLFLAAHAEAQKENRTLSLRDYVIALVLHGKNGLARFLNDSGVTLEDLRKAW